MEGSQLREWHLLHILLGVSQHSRGVAGYHSTHEAPSWPSLVNPNAHQEDCAVVGIMAIYLASSIVTYGEDDGTPLQHSCLENPVDGGAWWAAVHGVAKGRTQLSIFTFTFHLMHWRRKWQPTPVFLPGKSHGRRSLVGCSPWGGKESDTTDVTYLTLPYCNLDSVFKAETSLCWQRSTKLWFFQ